MSRLFEKLASGKMALGVWLKSGPSWVSTIAQADFDFVRPDMMFSAMDWRDLDHIHRTAAAAGITTWVRVPANPWLGGTGQLQVTVDVQRAFSLGIPIVGASIASAEQVRACVEVSKDWHRSGTGEYPNSDASFAAMHKKRDNMAVFVPHVEAGSAINEIDAIIGIDGVRIVMLAMTDLSKALGHAFQYDHEEVWKTLDGIVEKARARGITIAANMGYAYTTHEQMLERVRRLYDHGVRICLMQGADSMFENFSRRLVNDIRSATG
jgi:2-keto-3-deoxy-L-rhamnonate aldolase RhmA